MQNKGKLLFIKTIHTVVWAFFAAVIFYILYSGLADKITTYTWVGCGLVIAESLVLMAFKNHCPLTVIARKYSDARQDNFDIFLPNWLARYNKAIFSALYFGGLVVLGYRLLK